MGPSADSLPNVAHVMLAVESMSHQELVDFVPLCVLQTMMGGGGSFSAGGPGKGMYTRLYLNVLNRHHWIQNATAHNFSYLDAGIFAIHGSAPPDRIKDLIYVYLHLSHFPPFPLLSLHKAHLVSQLLLGTPVKPAKSPIFIGETSFFSSTGLIRQQVYGVRVELCWL